MENALLQQILTELKELKQGQIELKQGQIELKQGQIELKQDVRNIDQRVMRIEKEYGQRINGIYESIVGTGEKFTRLNVVENRVDKLEDDVFAIKEKIAE